jgi:hypothetical protein
VVLDKKRCGRGESMERFPLTNNYVSTKVSAISTKKVKWDGREGEDKLDRGGRRMKWVVL